jgi:hypothetical protein
MMLNTPLISAWLATTVAAVATISIGQKAPLGTEFQKGSVVTRTIQHNMAQQSTAHGMARQSPVHKYSRYSIDSVFDTLMPKKTDKQWSCRRIVPHDAGLGLGVSRLRTEICVEMLSPTLLLKLLLLVAVAVVVVVVLLLLRCLQSRDPTSKS